MFPCYSVPIRVLARVQVSNLRLGRNLPATGCPAVQRFLAGDFGRMIFIHVANIQQKYEIGSLYHTNFNFVILRIAISQYATTLKQVSPFQGYVVSFV